MPLSLGTAIAKSSLSRRVFDAATTMGGVLMSTFDNPFDAKRRLNRTGCACGQHASQSEHDRSAASGLQCTPVESQSISEDRRYEGVVASAVVRAMFPQDAARRAFLKSVGASTALAAVSQFFPLKAATEVFAQGAPLEKKDLKVGAPFTVTAATKKPDGTLESPRINVGRDGTVPQ